MVSPERHMPRAVHVKTSEMKCVLTSAGCHHVQVDRVDEELILQQLQRRPHWPPRGVPHLPTPCARAGVRRECVVHTGSERGGLIAGGQGIRPAERDNCVESRDEAREESEREKIEEERENQKAKR